MDSTGYNEDQPSTASDRMSNRVIIAIIVVQIIIALVSYPFLPALVPTHWNINGQVDSYAPKVGQYAVVSGNEHRHLLADTCPVLAWPEYQQ